jgi:hypothetical protein
VLLLAYYYFILVYYRPLSMVKMGEQSQPLAKLVYTSGFSGCPPQANYLPVKKLTTPTIKLETAAPAVS